MKENTNTILLNWILAILIINTVIISIESFNLLNNKYKYKIEFLNDEFHDLNLNRLGKDGWKVVGSRRASSSSEYGYELILMKEQ